MDDPADLAKPGGRLDEGVQRLARDTSTVAALTSNPALPNTSAATSALGWSRSATRTCLPALTRRAMACPIDPAPMTTVTSLTAISLDAAAGAASPFLWSL